jgi:hypothetical protein
MVMQQMYIRFKVPVERDNLNSPDGRQLALIKEIKHVDRRTAHSRVPLCSSHFLHLAPAAIALLVSHVPGSIAGGTIWRPTVDGRNSSKDPLQQSGCWKCCASFRMAEVGQLSRQRLAVGVRIPCRERGGGEYNTNPRHAISTWQTNRNREQFSAPRAVSHNASVDFVFWLQFDMNWCWKALV